MNTYTESNEIFMSKNKSLLFISEQSWFVKGDRKYGPVKSDIYFSGRLFLDGDLVNEDYEISQKKLNHLFEKVGA